MMEVLIVVMACLCVVEKCVASFSKRSVTWDYVC